MRAAAQRLTDGDGTKASPAEVLSHLVGLQAQVLEAAMLGIRARAAGTSRNVVDDALNKKRSIVRSWLMRGTLHLVAADDFRWLVGLLGPLFMKSSRHAQLGLTDDLKRRGTSAIQRILSASGPLTRYELVDQLRAHDVNLDPKTQAPIHLIQFAALQGALCLGPERNGETTYVLVDDWLSGTKARLVDDALSELARRYFRAFGPATVFDLAAWSGIPLPLARTGVQRASSSLVSVNVGGEAAFIVRGRATSALLPRDPTVRLLPTFDTYLLGYRDRGLSVPVALQRRVQRGGGWLHPVVVVDGRAVGAWQLRRSGARGAVVVEAFAQLSPAIRRGIQAEVSDIGRFVGLSMVASITSSRGRSGAKPPRIRRRADTGCAQTSPREQLNRNKERRPASV